MSQQSKNGKWQERWVIEIHGDRFLFSREINGCTEESYGPVNGEKAAVFVAAIIQGFEPPRLLTPADRGFLPPPTLPNFGKPVG